MKGDPDLAAFLPTGDEIEAAVAIEIVGLGPRRCRHGG
jgi:hypothetical protein